MARLNTRRMQAILANDRKRTEYAKEQLQKQEEAKAMGMYDIQPEVPEQNLDAAALEAWLTKFLHISRDANRRYDLAVAAEEHPNSAIQDILHAIELAPSTITPNDAFNMIHDYRNQRRSLKKELEATDLFKQWADQNKAAIDRLEQTLGAIRKVLKRQPNDTYRFKTGAVGIQGTFMAPDSPEEE